MSEAEGRTIAEEHEVRLYKKRVRQGVEQRNKKRVTNIKRHKDQRRKNVLNRKRVSHSGLSGASRNYKGSFK